MQRQNSADNGRDNRVRKGAGRLAKLLEVPESTVVGGAHIEMNGNRELFIESCRGVLEYTDSVVRVATVDYNIKVTGRDLKLRSLTTDTMLVEGDIVSLEFVS